MKKRIWVSMLIAGILFLSLSQNAKGDDRRALAEELLNVKQMQKTMEGSLAAMKRMMASQINNAAKSMGQDVPASATVMQKKMFALIAEEMSWDKMKDDLISVYADTYTEEELKTQIDFYGSPAGQAVADKESKLSEKVIELGQNRMRQIMPKIAAMMKPAEVGTPAPVEKTVTEPQKDNNDKEKAAVAAAEKWLTLVDEGKYAESWKEAAEYFKAAVKQEQWKQSLQAGRKPLGKLVLRKVKSASYKTSLPGAPDGEYVVIQFKASFENKKTGIETVTPMMDKDGKWRVSGYYIK